MDEKILHGKKNGMLVLLLSLLIYAVAATGLILTLLAGVRDVRSIPRPGAALVETPAALRPHRP